MTEPLPVAPRGSTRLEALTGVRAFAAAWVILLHFGEPLYGLLPGLRFAERLTTQGFLGVDLFFVLSGFILSFNYFDHFKSGVSVTDWGRFLRLRLARMWPTHVFTLHVTVAMYFAARSLDVTLHSDQTVEYTLPAYLHNLALTHAWTMGDLSWNAPSWTISAEWAAYLVFPALTLLVARATTLKRAWTGVAMAYLVWLVVVRLWLWEESLSIDAALPRAATQFLAGCFLFLVYRKGPRGRPSRLAAIAAILLLVTAPLPWEHSRAYLLTPLLGLGVLGLARGDRVLGPLLEHRAARYLGELSYSLYLTHGLVLASLGKVLPWPRFADSRFPSRVALIAVYFLVTGTVALFTYYVVERPARERIARRRVDTRGRGSPPPVRCHPP